jgi:peroxin-5
MTREMNGTGPKEGEMGPDEDGSSNLWHTLRRAFLCMVSLPLSLGLKGVRNDAYERGSSRQERHDLAEKAQPGTNVNDFRVEGFEF